MAKDLDRKFQEYMKKKAKKNKPKVHAKDKAKKTDSISKKFADYKSKKEKKPGFFSRLFERSKKQPAHDTSLELPKQKHTATTTKKADKKKGADELHEKYKDIFDDLKSKHAEKHDKHSKIDADIGSSSENIKKPETAKHIFSIFRIKKSIPEESKKTAKPVADEKIKKTAMAKKPGKDKGKKDVNETDIRKLFKKKDKEKRKKISASERKRRLADYLEKSGLAVDQATASKRIFYVAIFIIVLLTVFNVYFAVNRGGSIAGIIIQVMILWIIGFVFILGATRLVFMIYLDLLMFKRKLSVEEVLPDFLQLTSANIRAGMPIDRALWFAVRPRFGVLAKEIEDVAKRTLAGEDLHVALVHFAKKYDSLILLRSVYLLNEGMEAGGDVGDLLNKIALNIQQMRGMKKEMSANVTTYVIFISFAAMIAAPFLFGLSNQLLHIVQSIAGDVAAGGGVKSGIGLSINMSSDNIKMSDYRIFAYSCLTISSVFSAIIVATIKKGNVKEGLQYIPIYLIVSLIIFYIASKVLGTVMGGMF